MAKRTGRGRRQRSSTQRAPKSVRGVVARHSAARGLSGDSPGDRTGSTTQQSLTRILDAPHLARVVPHLAPEMLHQLIRHRGLDAGGDLVAAATPQQLASVFDLDLWRSAQPGDDERFDADRFGEWLELLADTDGTVAARTIAAMDENLVVAGLSRYVRVFDSAAFAPAASSDDEPIAIETPTGGVECEVGGYLVRSIRTEAWDAIVALLIALDADNPDCFHAVMRGCRRLSNSRPEEDGLDDLFMEPEQLMYDVRLDREHRRSQHGYSTPADARAYLQMARQRHRHAGRPSSPNPIAVAYFRAADQSVASTDGDATGPSPKPSEAPPADADVIETFDAVVDVLSEAGLLPQRPRALLEGAEAQQSRLLCIRTLMEYLRTSNNAAYLSRSGELAFLANTLVAGCSVQARPFAPQEASDAAVGICNLGLEHWPARWPETSNHGVTSTPGLGVTLPETFLVDHNLVTAFEVGWSVLHEDVCMFVAEQLLAAVTQLQCADAEIQEGLHALRIELTKQREAGTPWRASDALDVIAILDMPVWASLLGLMNECPVVPAALGAILERRTGAVSATAFEFISTTTQIGTVRELMALLPEMLRRLMWGIRL